MDLLVLFRRRVISFLVVWNLGNEASLVLPIRDYAWAFISGWLRSIDGTTSRLVKVCDFFVPCVVTVVVIITEEGGRGPLDAVDWSGFGTRAEFLGTK